MHTITIIEKKRDGHTLSNEELSFFLTEYLHNRVADYQMSAFLMAVFLNGLSNKELHCLTSAMTQSGDVITLPKTHRFIVDKHSTGGVGDKTSITLAPLLSACGLGVAKLTGRGLGHTGGTIDKFESISGFRFLENASQAKELIEKTGIALLGYTDSLVPLDKKLYTLRDVTATVPSIPLIASSIMSKKLAVSSDAIVLDVKVGNGAFMQETMQAKELAHTMLDIGKNAGRKVACVLSNMNQPLGYAIGNANEFIEAVETLKGNGPQDFVDLVCALAGVSLLLANKVTSIEEGTMMAQKKLQSQEPLSYLRAFIEYHGGNKLVVDDYSILPSASIQHDVYSDYSGYVQAIDTQSIGTVAMHLGAGRALKEDSIDHAAGINFKIKKGDYIQKGDTIASLYTNKEQPIEMACKMVKNAILFQKEKIEKDPILFDILTN